MLGGEAGLGLRIVESPRPRLLLALHLLLFSLKATHRMFLAFDAGRRHGLQGILIKIGLGASHSVIDRRLQASADDGAVL